jgi:hypothetical protein
VEATGAVGRLRFQASDPARLPALV